MAPAGADQPAKHLSKDEELALALEVAKAYYLEDESKVAIADRFGITRFQAARLVSEKIARNELGPKTGRGFFDYTGARRDEFETAKVRALLRQLRRQRQP